MKKACIFPALLLVALLAGCSYVANYPGAVNCRNSFQGDFFRILAIDEFSMEYTRNTFYYCHDRNCQRSSSAALPPSLGVKSEEPSSTPLVSDIKN